MRSFIMLPPLPLSDFHHGAEEWSGRLAIYCDCCGIHGSDFGRRRGFCEMRGAPAGLWVAFSFFAGQCFQSSFQKPNYPAQTFAHIMRRRIWKYSSSRRESRQTIIYVSTGFPHLLTNQPSYVPIL